MPKGLGRFEKKFYERLSPRGQRIWDRYHQTIKTAIFVMFFVAVVVLGLEARHANETADKARRDVNVIQEVVDSPCTPKANGEPKEPAACEASFNAVVEEVLTELQACTIVERGAGLLEIGGSPVPKVTCVKSKPKPNPGTPSNQGSKGSRSSSSVSGPLPAAGEGPVTTSPGTSPAQPGGSGGQGHPGQHPGEHQPPSGGGNPGGGETPGSGSPSPPATPPGSSEGAGGGSSSPPVATNPPPAEPGSTSGVGKVIEGAGEAVHEVVELVCHLNALGIRVCLPL